MPAAAGTVEAMREFNSQFLMVEKQGAIATMFFTNQEARVFNCPGAESNKRLWIPAVAGMAVGARPLNKSWA